MDNSKDGDNEEKFSWGTFGVDTSNILSLPKSSLVIGKISQLFTPDNDNEEENSDYDKTFL
jgi:hypothetical protein